MIKHIRIDERLIHGQVASAWSNTLRANRIMVINDAANGDDFQKQMLRMATPPSIALSVLTVEKAVNRIAAGNYDNDTVLVILKSIEDALTLYEAGYKFEVVNIGNISKKDDVDPIVTGIYINEKDDCAIKKLKEYGVNVTVQMTPNDSVMNL